MVSFEAVMHMQESMHKVQKLTSQVALSRMQPILHATRRITSRRFVLGARAVCLVGENPRYSAPTLQRFEGL